MSTLSRTLSALILVSVLPLVGPVAAQTPFTELSYEQAFEQSYRDGRLFVIFVDAPWHRQCRSMVEQVWTDPELVAWLGENALVVDLDTTKQPDMVSLLDVLSLPAVVTFRDGKEFERREGPIGAVELGRWLKDIRAGRHDLETLRKGAEDLGLVERLTLASKLAKEGAARQAAEQYTQLWAELGAEDAPMRRVPTLTQPIEQLVAASPNTRMAFLPALEGAWSRIKAEPSDRVAWGDWSYLGQALAMEETMVGSWLSLPQEAWTRSDPPPWLRHMLYDMLVAEQKFGAAVRVYPDLSQREDLDLKAFAGQMELIKRGKEKDNLPPARQFAIQDDAAKALRKSMAELYAVALASGDGPLADQVAQKLLAELDDARSRVALVRTGLLVKTETLPPQFATWLGEAEAQGSDVAALRQRLESQPR